MRSAWLVVMGQLELQLNRSTFDTWLRRAEPVRFADGVLTVKVRHAYAPDYIPQHFPDIEEMVTRAAGIPVKVAYECDVKLFNHHLSPAPAEVSTR
jgi:chromosomal replication initiation ATPase DnaA